MVAIISRRRYGGWTTGILQNDGAAAGTGAPWMFWRLFAAANRSSWRIWPSSGTPLEVLVATHHGDAANEKPESEKDRTPRRRVDEI